MRFPRSKLVWFFGILGLFISAAFVGLSLAAPPMQYPTPDYEATLGSFGTAVRLTHEVQPGAAPTLDPFVITATALVHQVTQTAEVSLTRTAEAMLAPAQTADGAENAPRSRGPAWLLGMVVLLLCLGGAGVLVRRRQAGPKKKKKNDNR